MNLIVGANSVTVTVSAPNEDSKTYTIVVNRSAFVNIGYVSNDVDVFHQKLDQLVKSKAAEKSIPLVEIKATTHEGQVSAIQTLIGNGVSAIALMPVSNDATDWDDILSNAEDAGIPVVFLYSYLGETTLPVTQIVSNDQAMAASIAEWFKTKIAVTANIVELEGILDHPVTINRKTGFDGAIDGDWTIIESITANFDYTTAYNTMATLLAATTPPIFQMVFAHNDNMALGAITALKAAGRTVGTASGDVFVGSIDATSDALDSIAAGELACTVEQGTASVAPLMFDALEYYYAATPTPMPATIDTIPVLYDATNVPSI